MKHVISIFSLFDGPVNNMWPCMICTLSLLYKWITTSPVLKAITAQLREFPPDSEERKRIKGTLPKFTPFGTFDYKRDVNMQSPSMHIILDLDKMESEIAAEELRDILHADKNLNSSLTYRSAGGLGVKLLVPVDFNAYEPYRETLDKALDDVWTYIMDTYSKDFKFDLDTCNRDLSRGSYLCYDEGAKVRIYNYNKFIKDYEQKMFY